MAPAIPARWAMTLRQYLTAHAAAGAAGSGLRLGLRRRHCRWAYSGDGKGRGRAKATSSPGPSHADRRAQDRRADHRDSRAASPSATRALKAMAGVIAWSTRCSRCRMLYGGRAARRRRRDLLGSNAKAKRELGYNPRPLEDGLRETLAVRDAAAWHHAEPCVATAEPPWKAARRSSSVEDQGVNLR